MIYKKIFSFKELDSEFDNIFQKIEKQKIPGSFKQFIFYSIAELFANVKEHSKAKKVNVKVKINKIYQIKIADDGIGLKSSYVSRGIYPKDDSSAIEFALAGLSTKDSKERGYGLYSIRKLIKNLKGKMEIKTGKSLAEIKEKEIKFKNFVKRVRGLSVLLETQIKEINFYKIIK